MGTRSVHAKSMARSPHAKTYAYQAGRMLYGCGGLYTNWMNADDLATATASLSSSIGWADDPCQLP